MKSICVLPHGFGICLLHFHHLTQNLLQGERREPPVGVPPTYKIDRSFDIYFMVTFKPCYISLLCDPLLRNLSLKPKDTMSPPTPCYSLRTHGTRYYNIFHPYMVTPTPNRSLPSWMQIWTAKTLLDSNSKWSPTKETHTPHNKHMRTNIGVNPHILTVIELSKYSFF